MSIISRKTTLHLAPVAAEALPAGQFGPVPAPLLAWTATITSVTWKSASGGDWSTAADWSGGKVPTASNSATIAAAGTYTVTISTADTAYSLLVNNKNVTVSDSSSLSVSGALTVTAGVFSLADGASITGGTLSTGANGSFYFNQSDGTDSDYASVLNGVTYQGTLNLGGGNEGLAIGGTLTMQGASGTGGGVINLSGTNDYLYVTAYESTPTLANGVMDIGSTVNTATGGANIEFTDTAYNTVSETLTIASNFDIAQSGAYAIIDKANPYTTYGYTTSIYNAGTITADISGGYFDVGYTNAIDSFTNVGSIVVSNGDNLGIDANATYNTGTITVNNASISIANLSATSGGTVLLTNGASAYLYGNYTLSAVQSVSGGVVDLGGTLTNTGTLLTSNGYYFQDATVDGGVIQDATGAQTFADVNYYGFSYIHATSLNSVTYQGTLNLAGGNSALEIGGTLTMQGGNGTGGGVINLTAQSDYLFITDSENTPTLANGVMNIGSSVDTATGGANIEFTDSGTQNLSETLTIASNFDIVQSGTYAFIDKANSYYGYSYATSIYNAGTITAGVSGGVFYIGVTNVIDSFTNAGSIAVSNSDALGINANATYNTGTITVNDASVSIENLYASAGGTVLLTNGASAYLYGNYTLSAVQSVSGGVVDLGGTLTNTGTLLTSNGYYLQYATVDGGVIQDATGAQTFADVNYYGFSYIDATSLNSVTYQGTLNLAGGNSALVIGGTLTMQGGNGTGGGVINLTAQSDYLFITDSENTPTLANGVMNIGSSVDAATGGANIEFTDSGTQNLSETLTIASNFDIVQSGTYAIIDKANSYYGYSYATSIYNAGTITAGVSGGGFYIGDTNAIDSFTNAGSIAVSNSDYLGINANATYNTGTITVNDASVGIDNLTASAGGTVLLTNGASAYLYGNYTLSAVQSVSGGVVDLGGTLTNTGTLLTSNGYYLQYATVDGGVIQDATGAQTFADVNYYGFSYIDATSLNSVTYRGTLNLTGGNSALVIGGTLTMQGGAGTGGGVINLTGQSDYLFITDSENTPTLATNPTRKYVTLFVSCSIPYFGRLEEGAHLGWLTL
jgi:microcompartment protein CcmK/EutM/copper chaperone CopZ